MKVVLVNDTSFSNHIGCKLVIQSFLRKCEEYNIEVLGSISWKHNWEDYRFLLDKADLVIVNGEGSIHHGRRMDLLEIAEYYPSALINAVYDSVPYNDHTQKFKYVSVRESLSAEYMNNHKVSPDIVPDLIFDNNIESLSNNGLVYINSVELPDVGINPYEDDFLNTIQNCHSICSGRFHGCCLAMMMNKPFSAYATNTHKTIGLLKDAGLTHLYSDTPDYNKIPYELDCSSYVNNAKQKIDMMFKKIKGCI